MTSLTITTNIYLLFNTFTIKQMNEKGFMIIFMLSETTWVAYLQKLFVKSFYESHILIAVMNYLQLMRLKMRPSTEWGPANTEDRARHQRYQDILPPIHFCDPHLLAKLMGSNISDISEIEKQVAMTPYGSVLLQTLNTPSMTPTQSRASLIAYALANGSGNLAQMSGSGSLAQLHKKRNSPSECSDV